MEEQTQPDAATTDTPPADAAAPAEVMEPAPAPAEAEVVAPDVAPDGGTMDIVDSVNTASQGALTHASANDVLVELGQSSIYMMGISFVLGSLFTILVLILLDFMRRNSEKK